MDEKKDYKTEERKVRRRRRFNGTRRNLILPDDLITCHYDLRRCFHRMKNDL